jgi:F0F1-type ATP synthase membrane subunit b/b'
VDLNVIASCLNFAVVISVLVYFGRQPIVEFFQARSETLSKAVREAEAIAQSAIQAKAESEKKLNAAQAEMVLRRTEVDQNLQNAKQQALSRASQEAERIHRDSQALVEGERLRARKALLKEVGEDSVAAVRRYLASSLEDKDKDALVSDYLNLVSTGHSGSVR